MRLDAGPRRLVLLAAVTLPLIGAAGATPGSSRFSFAGELGVGHDDNPFREHQSRHAGTDFPFDLLASYDLRPTRAWRFELAAHGSGALYPAPNREKRANETGADLRLVRRLFIPYRSRPDSARIDLELRGNADQVIRTNFSRSAGEEYFVIVHGDTVSLKDRYNYRSAGYAAEITLNWPPATKWNLQHDATRRDYIEDYPGVPTLDPLDFDDRAVSFGATQRIGRRLLADLDFRRARVEYDHLPARDFDGNTVSGTRQVYRFNSWKAGLVVRRILGSRLRLDYGRRTRTDPFQHYYDFKEWSGRVGCDLYPSPRWEVTLDFDYGHCTYRRAHVLNNPLKPLRDDIDRSVSGRAVYRLNAWGAVLVQAVYENYDRRNPIFAYSRTRGWIGWQVRS